MGRQKKPQKNCCQRGFLLWLFQFFFGCIGRLVLEQAFLDVGMSRNRRRWDGWFGQRDVGKDLSGTAKEKFGNWFSFLKVEGIAAILFVTMGMGCGFVEFGKGNALRRRVCFRMPAEWELHRGTWLTWPREEGASFPGRFTQICETYRRLVDCLAAREPVFINVWDEGMEQAARWRLGLADGIQREVSFFHHPAYEPWCRDHGPIFVRNCQTGKAAVVDWDYNAWGNKYSPFDLDNEVPKRIAALRGIERLKPKMVLEGGSIDVNGQGLLLTTESCLLNPKRNPHLSRKEIEQRLFDYLGAEEVLWLGEGIAGDDTDGHVDDLARFVSADTVAIAMETDSADANYSALRDNWERLRAFNKDRGHPLRIVELPMPSPVVQEGIRLPASYMNFYLANGLAIVPIFKDPNDKAALDILQSLLPERKVVGLNSLDLIWGLGSFHCITQQEPLFARPEIAEVAEASA